MRLPTLGPFVLTILVIAAGCIAPAGDTDDVADHDRVSTSGGTMTGEESRVEDATLCTDGLNLGATDQRFCATRTIKVDGTLSGFSTLDVSLQTFNGDVLVHDAPEGAWHLVATLKARGGSAEAAKAQLDAIDLTWSHTDARGHFVEAIARHEGDSSDLEAAFELQLPRSILLTVVAGTSNGDVTLTDLRTAGLALATSNGDVVARADVQQVSLTTSNGDVEAELRPTGDARWTLSTSNGNVGLKVPEGPETGYSFEGTTSNGEVTYTLKDGEKGPCPQGSEYYTPPCNHRTFETRGFKARETQVYATLTTSNGEVSAAPK
ncbi:MAG TPA: DUF4097 family beta strand repeat-containing protein [Candidatus Thermoplasmatota archaeon]|nr:DUF4097 family beta strand repeat-containing protein [Candidatus Thermoplasmatota archaeon]